MTIETLKEAKRLETLINNCNELLKDKENMHYLCHIETYCSNKAPHDEFRADLPRPIWNKMLDVLAKERDILVKELAEL